ncbi:MAG: T9SS type A sorting domain-containing protein [Bacteroidetes bacterium]|nr:T9SS type A sorting domain-containing protein [Bacteroidota bacterium]
MKKLFLLLFLTINYSLVTVNLNAQLPAFPGAEGFGKYAKGGRGGKVVEVTNLNDTGVGSFRWAFTQHPDTPITIVFKVSGIIDLQSQLKVNRSNFTVAGQTAPGDGICLKGHSFICNGARLASLGGNHGNIIIRYLRSRPGSTLSTGVYGFDMENCHNVIIDHCSFSWANEECAALYDTKNTTVQWCIMSEGLYNAGHAKGVRSYCGVWGGQNASYHHNLIAHQNNRTVRFNGARAHDTAALIDYRNNVIYNWVSSSSCYGGEIEIPNGYAHTNIVNNFYKPGPSTSSTLKFIRPDYPASSVAVARWHLKGNIMNGNAVRTNDNWQGVDFASIPLASRDSAKCDSAFYVTDSIQMQSAQNAYDSVLVKVGAIYPLRDSTDKRIINETKTGTATGVGSLNKLGIIDLPSAVGGWNTYNTYNVPDDTDHDGMPDFWEIMKGLDINNPEDRNDTLSNGYTRLEEYLNSIPVVNTLPVRLINFSVQKMNTTNKLNWSIENNNEQASFIIEKSEDGKQFYSIKSIKSSNENEYSCFDAAMNKGTIYYRIKIANNNGIFFYSPVITVGNVKKNFEMKVYPNPLQASSWLHINAKLNNGITLTICDINGKAIWKNITSIVEGNNLIALPYEKLSKGMYLLRIYGINIDESTVIIK